MLAAAVPKAKFANLTFVVPESTILAVISQVPYPSAAVAATAQACAEVAFAMTFVSELCKNMLVEAITRLSRLSLGVTRMVLVAAGAVADITAMGAVMAAFAASPE